MTASQRVTAHEGFQKSYLLSEAVQNTYPAIFVQKSKERDGMEPIYFPLFQDKDYVSPLTTLGEDRALKG